MTWMLRLIVSSVVLVVSREAPCCAASVAGYCGVRDGCCGVAACLYFCSGVQLMATRECSIDDCRRRVVGRKLCRRHYQQAWKRGDFENAPLPARKPGKTICPAEHKHDGSSTCYIQHQCRCVPCKEHHSKMEQHRQRQTAYGRFDTGLVDAEPVREHMVMLAGFGLGYKRVAALAGIGITPARNLIWGRQEPGPRYGEMQKRVKRETAEALLAVQPDIHNLALGAHVSSRATHRRLQALVAIGWSQSKLGKRLAVDPTNFSTLMKAEQVTVRRHLQVVDLFEELWNQRPPAESHRDKISYTRSLSYAKKRRWLPPLAWDDVDTDPEPPVPDEVGRVDEVRVLLAISGERVRLTPEERRAAVVQLHGARMSDPAIGERLRCTPRTVLRIRQELELPAIGTNDEQIVA